jgi:hypothetical protein
MTMRILAIAAILAATLATTARAQETWVAVASDGRSNFGDAVGMATREAAEISAAATCGGGCRIVLTAPARCAFARSDAGNASGYGAGPTRKAAQQTAWDDCNRHVPSFCTVRAARCFE